MQERPSVKKLLAYEKEVHEWFALGNYRVLQKQGELTGFFDEQWDRALCELSRNESLIPCFARKRIRQLLRPAPRPITPNLIQVCAQARDAS